jgi:hypothetical protein
MASSNSTDNPATPAAIDKALRAQLSGICQAQAIIKLTAESMIEAEDNEIAMARAHEALNGAYVLLDNVLVRLETIEDQIRGKVAS